MMDIDKEKAIFEIKEMRRLRRDKCGTCHEVFNPLLDCKQCSAFNDRKNNKKIKEIAYIIVGNITILIFIVLTIILDFKSLSYPINILMILLFSFLPAILIYYYLYKIYFISRLKEI